MKFIRLHGKIIPIGDKQKQIGDGKKPTYAHAESIKKATEPKVTISFKNKILRKFNGLKNKFKGVPQSKLSSAYNVAQGKHLGNKIGQLSTFGKTKKIFDSQASKSGRNLSKISKLVKKNKSIKSFKGGVVLGALAIGGLAYLKNKNKEQEYYE
jgi:hypothetical protein